MRLQLISAPKKVVQFSSAEQTVAAAWHAANAKGAQVVMWRDEHSGFKMLRRDELEHYATVRPYERIATLPLHDVGVASSLVTVRELELQLQSSGVEAIAMMRANEVVALVTRSNSDPGQAASASLKFRSAA